MLWAKYPKIENSYNEEVIEQLKEYDTSDYVVVEKIDGANVSVIVSLEGSEVREFTSGETFEIKEPTIRIASRNQVVDNFLNMERVLDRNSSHLRNRFLEAFICILEEYDYPDDSTVVFYGEHFGGKYPHPEAEYSKDVFEDTKVIQGRVKYIPYNDFIMFDIAILVPNSNYIPKGVYFLDYKTMTQYGRDFEIPYTKPLFFGTLDECLAYNETFLTTIPKQFMKDVPDLENNFAEGVIIRSYRKVDGNNLMIKKKSEKFKEKNTPKKPRVTKEYSDNLNTAISIGELFVTQGRLDNIVSHVGEVSIEGFSFLLAEFIEDVMEDFFHEEYKLINLLDSSEKKILKKVLSKECAKLVRHYFKVV